MNKSEFAEKWMADELFDCWKWKEHTDKDGYGRVTHEGKTHQAHRFAWELYFTPIPQGKCVLHNCHNKSCVNPYHLYIGDRSDNAHDEIKIGNWNYSGENNGRAKLSKKDVKRIRELYNRGVSQSELSDQFGTTQSNISHIVNGMRWKDEGGA